MNPLIKIYMAACLCSLTACGNSDSTDAGVVDPVLQEKEVAAGRASPHTLKGMKDVMDDARGVEDLLQQRHDEQRKEIDGIR